LKRWGTRTKNKDHEDEWAHVFGEKKMGAGGCKGVSWVDLSLGFFKGKTDGEGGDVVGGGERGRKQKKWEGEFVCIRLRQTRDRLKGIKPTGKREEGLGDWEPEVKKEKRKKVWVSSQCARDTEPGEADGQLFAWGTAGSVFKNQKKGGEKKTVLKEGTLRRSLSKSSGGKPQILSPKKFHRGRRKNRDMHTTSEGGKEHEQKRKSF